MALPRKKNFLRDVLPKGEMGNFVSLNKIKKETDVVYQKIKEPIIEYGTKDGRWRIWAVAGIAVVALAVVLLYVFSSAEVVVVPRVDQFEFDNDFSAKSFIEGQTVKVGGELYFLAKPVETTGFKNISSDGQKMVEKKASGTIMVYNNYSSSSQKLIRNTRFETSDGLIYRIDKSIIVPGKTTAGGKTIPGTVEATVYADAPGVKYNIGPSNFTIPGFKSDKDRYAGFYARSESPMLDGYSGMANYLTDAKQKLVRAEIRSELEKKILTEAMTALGSDYFIPNGAYTLVFESLPLENISGNQVSVKEKAKALIYSFNVREWDMFLAENTKFRSAIGSSTVKIANREALDFAWRLRPKTDSPEISFHISGDAEFIWVIDQNKVAMSLADKKRAEVQETLKQFDGVVSATGSLSPFWRRSFPSDPTKITIMIKLPE